MKLTPGTRLDLYEIVGPIGAGGMGEVYRARDTALKREVAIKILSAFTSQEPQRLRRFEQEAQAAAALNHPNILAVYHFGNFNGAAYLVSELLQGETLREQLKRGRLPVRKAIDFGVQMARGLAAAHEKSIVHRDLKPENLFVTKEGIKILDFGLAKLTQPPSSLDQTEETQPGTVSGTVGYMPPEQVRGQATDDRSDIFALGAVLYEMLTGVRAFQKPTPVDTLSAILNEDPPAFSQFASNTPPALQRVVHRCLQKKPEQRFQSASDLAFALEALAENSGSGSGWPRAAAAAATSITFLRRHKGSLAACLLLIGLMLGALFYSARGRRSRSVWRVGISYKQFTFLGDVYDPALSPDGLLVAYVVRKPGEENRLMLQAADGAELELARGLILRRPRWSPNGAEVLFERGAPSMADWAIAVVSRLGGTGRLVGGGRYGCWLTTDGSQIVTAWPSEQDFPGVSLVNKLTGQTQTVHLSKYGYLMDIDCSAKTEKILAVTLSDGVFQIRVFAKDGSQERVLLEDNDSISTARWSPAGDAIYYLHGTGSTVRLSKISVRPRHPQPDVLVDGLQAGDFFTLSADGLRLAYTRENESSNLWRVALPPAGKTAKPAIDLLTTGTSYYGAPVFSPDGNWIAFARGPNADETNIFRLPEAGGDASQLTFFEHVTTASPAWSPDGRRIGFIGDQGGVPRVWTIGATGGTPHALEYTNALNTYRKLAWRPSADIVYTQPGMKNVLRIDEGAHQEAPLILHPLTVGGLADKPVVSPDGKRVALFWNGRKAGLWIFSVDPYFETLLAAGLNYPFDWSSDGKYIYAIRRTGTEEGREVIRVQVEHPSEVTSVAMLPGDVVERDGATLSPDGKQIVASVAVRNSDVWLMENFDPSAR